MLLKGFDKNGRGAAPPILGRALFRRRRRRHFAFSLGHVSIRSNSRKQSKHDTLSKNSSKLSEPIPAQDGIAMFREIAGTVAPGRTVATQIRAVARALYGSVAAGWRRTKACCYGEAGAPTVLNFKYRYEAWRKQVARDDASVALQVKALAERLNRVEQALAHKDGNKKDQDLAG